MAPRICGGCPHAQSLKCGPFVGSQGGECPRDVKREPTEWIQEEWRDIVPAEESTEKE